MPLIIGYNDITDKEEVIVQNQNISIMPNNKINVVTYSVPNQKLFFLEKITASCSTEFEIEVIIDSVKKYTIKSGGTGKFIDFSFDKLKFDENQQIVITLENEHWKTTTLGNYELTLTGFLLEK